jgi:neutral ceramidase
VTATHTHSAPTGYSTYLMYALSAPGFSRRVLDGLAAGIVASVKAALASLTSAEVFVHRGEVPRSEPVLFNRALAAYAQNPEVTPVPFERRDEAVSRTMTVVSAVSESGVPLGVVTWLGCHRRPSTARPTTSTPTTKGSRPRCSNMGRKIRILLRFLLKAPRAT